MSNTNNELEITEKTTWRLLKRQLVYKDHICTQRKILKNKFNWILNPLLNTQTCTESPPAILNQPSNTLAELSCTICSNFTVYSLLLAIYTLNKVIQLLFHNEDYSSYKGKMYQTGQVINTGQKNIRNQITPFKGNMTLTLKAKVTCLHWV